MTKDELKARIVPRLANKHQADLTWQELVSAVQLGTAHDRAKIVQFASNGDSLRLGGLMLRLVKALMRGKAESEADAMLADDVMSIEEIERAFE